jgi:hypothetical protein
VLAEGESKFYIPTYLIEKYEGGKLWFRIDEGEAKSKFMLVTSPMVIGTPLGEAPHINMTLWGHTINQYSYN